MNVRKIKQFLKDILLIFLSFILIVPAILYCIILFILSLRDNITFENDDVSYFEFDESDDYEEFD